MTQIVAPKPTENTVTFFQSISRLLTYLSGKVRDDGTLALANKTDTSTTNNSLYYSTTSSAPVFKNSSGTVISLSGGGGGGGTPAGSNTQIQYNNAGAFGGSASFTYDNSTKLLSLTGKQIINASSSSTTPLTLKGAASPTANFFQVQDSTGTVNYVTIQSDGALKVNNGNSYIYWATIGTFSGTPPNTGDLNVGNYGLWCTGPVTCAKAGAAIAYVNRAFDFSGWGWIQLSPTYDMVFASYTTGEGIRINQYGGIEFTGQTRVNTNGASTIGLIVKGAASQTANLQEWQNSAGTIQTLVAASGLVSTVGNAAWNSGVYNGFKAEAANYPSYRFYSSATNKGACIYLDSTGGMQFGVNGTGDTFGTTIFSLGATGVAVNTSSYLAPFTIKASGTAYNRGIYLQADVDDSCLCFYPETNYFTITPTYVSTGSYRSLKFEMGGAKNIVFSKTGALNLPSFTVATLPTGAQGDRCYVTDALAPAFLVALTGGGAVKCPAFYDGAAWVAG